MFFKEKEEYFNVESPYEKYPYEYYKMAPKKKNKEKASKCKK